MTQRTLNKFRYKNYTVAVMVLLSALSLTADNTSITADIRKGLPGITSSSMKLEDRFEAVIQHYCVATHNLVNRALKNKPEGTTLHSKEVALVQRAAKDLETIIPQIRHQFFSDDKTSQAKAIESFANHITNFCKECGFRTYHLFSVSNPGQTQEEQIQAAEQAVALLETRYKSIQPLPPILKRLESVLFYNVITTKIAPRILRYTSPLIATSIAGKLINADIQRLTDHPHNNWLFKYRTVSHDEKIEYRPSWLERKFGKAIQQASPPDGINKLIHEFAQMLQTNPPGENSSNHTSDKAKEEIPMIQPCRLPREGHLCNNTERYDSDNRTTYTEKNGRNRYTPTNPEAADRWTCGDYQRCNNPTQNEPCYAYMGINDSSAIATHMTKLTLPFALIPTLIATSHIIEDAQLPEYTRRIKEKEKLIEEKRIQQEMRMLKINYEKNIGFAQVKGQQTLIDREMRLIVDYLTHPFRYKNGTSGTRSILMYGPPGTGKTLLARAIAKESGAPFLEITADDIISENSKEKIMGTLRMAEEVASKRPEKSAIIYIDEIDCVTGNREQGGLDPQRAKALSNLLAIFDGIEKRNPYIHIVIIITTNHHKNLDPALLRPGRIDRKIFIGVPDADGRREFFESFLPAEHKHLIEWFVQETAGCNGAQIVNIIDTAHMIASYNRRPMPTEQDYRTALENSRTELEAFPETAKVH